MAAGHGLDRQSRRLRRPLETTRTQKRLADDQRPAPQGAGARCCTLHEGLNSTRRDSGDKVEALYRFLEDLGLPAGSGAAAAGPAQEAGRLQEAEEYGPAVGDPLRRAGPVCGDPGGRAAWSWRSLPGCCGQVLTQYSVGTIPVALDQVSVSEITRNDRHTARVSLLAGGQRPRAAGGGPGRRHCSARTTGRPWPCGASSLAPTGMDADGHVSCRTSMPPWPSPRRACPVSYPVTDVTGAELRPAFVVEPAAVSLFPMLRLERGGPDKEYRFTAPAAGTGGGGTVPRRRPVAAILPRRAA